MHRPTVKDENRRQADQPDRVKPGACQTACQRLRAFLHIHLCYLLNTLEHRAGVAQTSSKSSEAQFTFNFSDIGANRALVHHHISSPLSDLLSILHFSIHPFPLPGHAYPNPASLWALRIRSLRDEKISTALEVVPSFMTASSLHHGLPCPRSDSKLARCFAMLELYCESFGQW